MIAFGVAVSDLATYESVALPGIRRAAEPDTRVLTRIGLDSIQQPYNEMMDEAAALDDLEALILLHQDLELVDASLPERVRRSLCGSDVGAVGAFGLRGPDPHRWSGPGGGAGRAAPLGFRMMTALGRPVEPGTANGPPPDRLFGQGHSEAPAEVELLDGILLALAPWVVRSIRFDERLARQFHGYDLDFSLRIRAAGGRLIADPIPMVHHQERPWRDREELIRSRIRFARRWDPDVRPLEWAPAFQA